MQKSMNRYFKNQRMDNIDHALGRPENPLKESHRNYFETRHLEEAAAFMTTGYWNCKGTICVVNAVGRQALHDFIEAGQ